jgi:hypothetical protein
MEYRSSSKQTNIQQRQQVGGGERQKVAAAEAAADTRTYGGVCLFQCFFHVVFEVYTKLTKQ